MTQVLVADDVRAHIAARLATAAAEEGVRIIYAAESGSRAWGFPSPDSDYDVRFLYAHPREWYVTLAEARDVIERPEDEQRVDLAGWDIRKALRLLLRSNPALYEWLVSPMVYVDSPQRAELKALFEAHASPRALAHHYWSIARGQWRAEVAGRTEVRLKKYLYVVRPLLCLAWVAERQSPPPMSIDDLLCRLALPPAPRRAVEALLGEKRATPGLGTRPPIAEIDAWAVAELERLDPDRLAFPDAPRLDMRGEADRLYRRIIGLAA
ncbi:MAG: nucleotidyltransferase domain-containing protein [Hyphomicrobiaceae bacterium]|nr:nucleotidyltransferase domain-containing protein [Hyphomicrobiaceae bacterium]